MDYDLLILLMYLMDTYELKELSVSREWFEQFLNRKELKHLHTRRDNVSCDAKWFPGVGCDNDGDPDIAVMVVDMANLLN